MSAWWKKWSISSRGSGRMKLTPRPSRPVTRCCSRPPVCGVRSGRMTHRRWLPSLSIVALLCVPLAGWGASIVITVPPEAQVQGPQITLGDVAEIQGEPADMVSRMRQVRLGQAPPAGVARLLSKSTLVTQLKHQGLWTPELQFQGALQIRVMRASQRLEPQHMETVVRQALSRRLPQTTQPTSIRAIRGLSPVFVPLGPVQYEVTVPGRNGWLGS